MMKHTVRSFVVAGLVAVTILQAEAQFLATGGDVAYVTNINGIVYCTHIYTNVGVHTFTTLVPLEVEVLVVGGGGGGGATMGGGGGAGGLIYTNGYMLALDDYVVTVGEGGLGGYAYNLADQAGTKGSNSSFSEALVVLGGGGGCGWSGHPSSTGGSGGGGNSVNAPSSGTPGQGNSGGPGQGTSPRSGGGGGGAGEVGGTGTVGVGGKGGDGLAFFGRYYAGGGGGGIDGAKLSDGGGAGGLGGGGAGSRGTIKAIDAEPNTGGGGGGAGYDATGTGRIGGNGGDGIVIVRYLADTDLPQIMNVGLTDLTDTTADIVGSLGTNGASEATVTLYWATTDYTTNATDWVAHGYSSNIGPYVDGAIFTNTLSDLSANMVYYWNHGAVNASGTVWATSAGSPSFKTLGPPSVDNAGGATSVGVSVAVLNGTLLDGAPADVYADLWVDGSGVTNQIALGAHELGTFSVTVPGLTAGTLYRYRCFVSNDYGTDLAATTAAFTTLPAAYTSGNVTWSGGAGAEVPYWEVPANWVESGTGLNKAPSNPTPATLFFADIDTSDSIAKLMPPVPDWEGTTPTNAWRIGQLRVVNTTDRHLIDLDGKRLELGTDLYVQRASGSAAARLHLSGAGRLTVGQDVLVNLGHLVLGDTTLERHPTLDRNVRTMTAGTSGGSATVDLRGTTIEGGSLDLTNLSIGIGRGQGILYLDGTTGMHTLRVTGTTRLNEGQSSNARIGAADPNRGNEFFLPDGLNMVFGNRDTGEAGRGVLSISHHTEGYIGSGYGRFAAGNGGSFDAWLSVLRVGHNSSQYQGPATGTLDLRGVDTFDLDATEARIGSRVGSYSRVVHGYAYFPAGTGRVDRLYMGDNVAAIASRLDLTGTVLKIDEFIDLKDTGTNTRLTVRVLGQPSGLDLAAGATITTAGIGTPKIYLRFEEAPDGGLTPHWGLRKAGDHAVTIAGWVDSGLIEMSMHFVGAEDDYQTVVYYDSGTGYTYAGLLDAGAVLPPVIEVQDRTVEVRGQTAIRIGPDDLLAGVNNPSNIEELSRAISHATLHGGTEQPYLDFPTDGALPVTYTDVTVTLHFAGDVTVSDTANLTFRSATAGVTGDLTWEGRAGLQHDARREWQWSLNWSGDTPPANPTTGTLTFGDDDTDDVVPKRLAPVADWEGASPTNAWTIGSLRAGNNAGWQVIDLDGQTLRTTGQVLASRLASGTARMKIQNGTLDVGTDLRVLNGSTLDLSGMGGTVLGIGNLLAVGGGSTLTLTGGVALDGRFGALEVGRYGNNALDLRGTVVDGGVLDIDALHVGGGNSTGTLWLDTNTLHTLIVRDTAHLNAEGQRGGANIGEQVGGQWFLPAGTDVRIGAADAPGVLVIGYAGSWVDSGLSRLAGSSNATFEAWVETLTVSETIGSDGGNPGQSVLDLRKMDGMTLHAATMKIGVGNTTRRPYGQVYLCSGTAMVGDLTIGHVGDNAATIALLELNDTVMSVTNTFNPHTGVDIRINVAAGRASGLELPALPVMPALASMLVTFEADPTHGDLHYGLKVPGNVVDDLTAAAWLTWDDDALADNNKATLYHQAGYTYLGIPPPPGSLFLFR